MLKFHKLILFRSFYIFQRLAIKNKNPGNNAYSKKIIRYRWPNFFDILYDIKRGSMSKLGWLRNRTNTVFYEASISRQGGGDTASIAFATTAGAMGLLFRNELAEIVGKLFFL